MIELAAVNTSAVIVTVHLMGTETCQYALAVNDYLSAV